MDQCSEFKAKNIPAGNTDSALSSHNKSSQRQSTLDKSCLPLETNRTVLDIDEYISSRLLQLTRDVYKLPCTDISSISSTLTDSIPFKFMLWRPMEAFVRQVEQIGTSACGATAVLTVLKAMNINLETEQILLHIRTRLRAEESPLPEYLLSRSNAGTVSADLIQCVQSVTSSNVIGNFFHLYPQRDLSLSHWLLTWMSRGAVPVATLNLQKAVPPGEEIPDAWHHQMIFGVSPLGIYLTNPLQLIPEEILQQQLCSKSVLLVRRCDVISRRDTCVTEWNDIIDSFGQEWQELHVAQQIRQMFDEEDRLKTSSDIKTLSHIVIPAQYLSGITLFAQTGTDAYQELMAGDNELPLHVHT